MVLTERRTPRESTQPPDRLGAAWAGGCDETPPQPLDAAIIQATVGDLAPFAGTVA